MKLVIATTALTSLAAPIPSRFLSRFLAGGIVRRWRR